MIRRQVSKVKRRLGRTAMARRLRVASLRRAIGGRLDPDRAIVLTGTPRSGTTWVGQVLAGLPTHVSLFETIMPDRVKESRPLGFRPYRRPGANWPEATAFLMAAASGNVLNDWTTCEFSRDAVRGAEAAILKEVRLTRLLPWISEALPSFRLVYVVRNPLATIASQLQTGWFAGTNDYLADELLKDFPKVVDLLPKEGEAKERDAVRLARAWCLDNLVPLSLLPKDAAVVVRYAKLKQNPTAEFQAMFEQLGVEVPSSFEALVAKPSRVTTGHGIGGSQSWETILTADDAAAVRDVLDAFGLGFVESIDADLLDPTRAAELRDRYGYKSDAGD